MFDLSKFPSEARRFFQDVPILWPSAVEAAVIGGITNLDDLANLVFFMHHKERMSGQTAKPLDPKEPEFTKLAAEWSAFRKMLEPIVRELTKIGATPSGSPSSKWKLSPEERQHCFETGGDALLSWAEIAPTAKREADEFRPASGQRARFKTIFAWKSQHPNRTCIPNPNQRVQLVLMLRDDIEFWRERAKSENQAVIKQSAAATAVRAYRHHIVDNKRCPEAARQMELELQKQFILQMMGAMYAIIPVPTKEPGLRNVRSLADLLSALPSLFQK